MNIQKVICRSDCVCFSLRALLLILALSAFTNLKGSEQSVEYFYRNFAGDHLSMSLFRSRNNFTVGDTVESAKPCELGISEVCYSFGGTLFAIPQDEQEVLELSEDGGVTRASLHKKFENVLLLGKKVDLLILESSSSSHSVLFYYSFEYGIMAFSLSAEGENAIFWSVGDCGYGSLRPPCGSSK